MIFSSVQLAQMARDYGFFSCDLTDYLKENHHYVRSEYPDSFMHMQSGQLNDIWIL